MEQYRQIAPERGSEFAPNPCIVESKTVRVLPDWEGLESYSKEAESLCCELDRDSPWEAYEDALVRIECLVDYATLIGGYPRWVQGEAKSHCSSCGADRELVVQIDSEELAGLMWGDMGLVYLFSCKSHPDDFHLELQCH